MFDDLPDDTSSFSIIILLTLNCLFQNAIYYYFIYIYFNDASQSFAITSLIILILTKLVWYIGMSVPLYDNNSLYDIKCLCAAFCGVIIFGDFVPFVIVIMLFNASRVSWKWLCAFIAHMLLISFPMTIVHFAYIIMYDKSIKLTIVSIICNMLAYALLAVYFARTVSWRISVYNWLSIVVDFINIIIKIYFLTNFIYNALFNTQDIDKSFWNNKIIYYCSWLYFVKTFVTGPLYAMWIFIFMCFESTPCEWPLLTCLMRDNCITRTCKLFFCIQCLCVFILYLIISVFLILTIWILTECIFYSYPFLIFLYFNANHWKKCTQRNRWNYVMKYMNNSVNANDWRVRLYLLNYLFWSTNPTSSTTAKFKDKGLLHKIKTALNWYVERDENNTDLKQMFDIKIFRHKFYDSNGITETIAIEYAYLLVDVFDGIDAMGNLFDVRNDALMHFCNSTHPDPNTPFECWYSGKEFAGLFIIIPLQLIASIYAAFVYPLIVYIMFLLRNSNSQQFIHQQNSEIFWMISIYWLLVIVMLYFMISFVKFFYVWWHCLYRDHIGTIPCTQLSGFYEYIHSHKAIINIIKTFFGPLSHEILGYLGLVVNDINKEDVKIDNDKSVNKEKEEGLFLPIPKDVKQVLTDNNYISNKWDYKDFVGYKKTAKLVQNNENMLDNWHHYLFKYE